MKEKIGLQRGTSSISCDYRTMLLARDAAPVQGTGNGRNTMHRKTTRIRRQMALAGLAAVLAILPGAAIAEDDRNEEGAAEARAGQLDDHEAEAEDPDDRTVGSEELDDMEAGSEDADQRRASSEDPDSMDVDSEDIERHEAASEDLTDLPAARPDSDDDSIEAPGRTRWETTTDPEVVIARDNLARAERRTAAAEKAYGEMRQNNYPRGDARVRIVNERDEARRGLEEAQRALAAAEE
jgi:hypothetical protein